MTAEPAPSAELITLDELTRRVGMSVRNVRFYTTKGLVPPPIRRGRCGYYNRDHVSRLELVRELQAHGFTLSAIERYLSRLPDDATPDTIAVHRTLLAPYMAVVPETLTRAQLDERAGRRLRAPELSTLEALGVVAGAGRGKYQVAVGQLSIAIAIMDLGLPIEAALAAQEIFTSHGRSVADELSELFRRTVWPAYKEGGVSPDQLMALLENFKPVSVAALVDAYQSAVNAQRHAFAERLTR